MKETFVQDEFEEAVKDVTDKIERLVDRDEYRGEITNSTYREEESPVDLEVKISGEWADLIGITALVTQSDVWTACTFTQCGESNNAYLGLTYHEDPEGLFCVEEY